MDNEYNDYNVFQETNPEEKNNNYAYNPNGNSKYSGHGYQNNINNNGLIQNPNGINGINNMIPNTPYNPVVQNYNPLPSDINLPEQNVRPLPYINPYQMQASRYGNNQQPINSNIPDPRRFGQN